MNSSYRELKVWQKALELVYLIYELTRKFPKDELYGLCSQMRRAAVSIPSNIAEGKGRNSVKELNQFLFHARGSLHELETQLLIADHLGYLSDAKRVNGLISEVARMLNGLISYATERVEQA